MKYLLAHDLGTSGNKATVFSTDGKLIYSCTESYGCHYFNGCWAEQDPADWWQAVVNSTKRILEKVDAADIAGISFSGQMMGCLCLDSDGNPLRPSIIWADMRATKESDALAEKISADRFYKLTGHRNTSSYGIQKLMWIKNNEPEIYEKTYKAVNAKDYIAYKLTGEIVTDYSDGASFSALDINTLEWSQEIIDAAGVDISKFPDAYPSTHIVGGVTKAAGAETGLREGTPVVIGGGDGCAATIGAGCINKGDAYCVMGSSAWITFADDRPFYDTHHRTFNWPGFVPGSITPCGSMQAAGVSYAWMKDVLCEGEAILAQNRGVSVYDMINERIAASPVGANNILYLPYILGERSPRWNANARGAFIGMSRSHTHNDMLRAVVEGISMNLGVIFNIYKSQGHTFDEITVIGGGMKSPEWRQIMADTLNTNIVVPNYLEEATSMGAALAAGVGVGEYADFGAINKFIERTHTVRPIPENVAKYAKLYPVFEKAYAALLGVYDDLAAL